jgi:hypothetical protein
VENLIWQSFAIRHSPFAIRHSPFAIRHFSLVTTFVANTDQPCLHYNPFLLRAATTAVNCVPLIPHYRSITFRHRAMGLLMTAFTSVKPAKYKSINKLH